MSQNDDLLALKRKIEGDLYSVNRALALLGEKSGKNGTEKQEPGLFRDKHLGEGSVKSVFETALKTMGDKEFQAREIIEAMRQLQPGRAISENTVFSLMWKYTKSRQIKMTRQKSGQTPALYVKV